MHPSTRQPLSPIWAVVGPAVVGLAVGIARPEHPGLTAALLLPAVVGGVVALTSPALYIGAAFSGLAPSPRTLLLALQHTLRDAGLAMAGLAPAMLFLAATAHGSLTPAVLAAMVVALSAVIGLRLLYSRLFSLPAPEPATQPAKNPDGTQPLSARAIRQLKSATLFTLWAAVVLGIGAYLLSRALLPGLTH